MKMHARTLVSLGAAAVLALLAFTSAAFLLEAITTASVEAAKDREGIESDTKRAQESRSLSRMYADTEEKRARLRSFFVEEGGVADFIEYVESLGRKAGVTLEVRSVEVLPVAEGGESFEELALTIETRGSWSEVMSFEQALETAPYGISITTTTFEREGDTRPLWRADVSLSVLALKKL